MMLRIFWSSSVHKSVLYFRVRISGIKYGVDTE